MTSPLQTTDLTRDLLALVPLLNRLVAAEVRLEVGEGATLSQFRVLELLEPHPLSLSELAQTRRVSLQAMGELAQLLDQRGWVTRTSNPADRRQTLLSLTETGRTHYRSVLERLFNRLNPPLSELSKLEQEAVRLALPALQRVLAKEEVL